MAIFAATEGSAAGDAASSIFRQRAAGTKDPIATNAGTTGIARRRIDSPPVLFSTRRRWAAGKIRVNAKSRRLTTVPNPGDAAPKANGALGIASEGLPAGVAYDDFVAYMVQAEFIYMPTGQLWPANSVNARPAVDWRDQTRRRGSPEQPVEQMTWMPGAAADHPRPPDRRGRMDRAPGRAGLQPVQAADARVGRRGQAGPLVRPRPQALA